VEVVVFAGFGPISHKVIINSKYIVEKIRSKGIPATLSIIRVPALDGEFEPFAKLGDEEIHIPTIDTDLDQVAEEIAGRIAEKLGFTMISGFPVHRATITV